MVRLWASALNRETYQAQETGGGLLFQSTPPVEIEQAMEPRKQEMQRSQSAMRLMARHHAEEGTVRECHWRRFDVRPRGSSRDVRRPSRFPRQQSLGRPHCGRSLRFVAHLLRGEALLEELLLFAVETVLRVGAGEGSPRQFEFEETYFEQAADRSAARVIPLLLLPNATALRILVDGADGSAAYARAVAGAGDSPELWRMRSGFTLRAASIVSGRCPALRPERCHHDAAFDIVIESMRDSVFGKWDPKHGRRRVIPIEDPVAKTLADTAADAIYVARLDAAIRALAPASMACICIVLCSRTAQWCSRRIAARSSRTSTTWTSEAHMR